MTFAETTIVCSEQDNAGLNVRDRLLERFDFEKTDDTFDSSPVFSYKEKALLVTSRSLIIDVRTPLPSGVTRAIFVSRHVAESGIPSLTAHFTGNFGPEARFGGNPREIGRYSPSLLKMYFTSLNSRKEKLSGGFEVTLEATHHGPTSLPVPLLFVELGSDESQWDNREAAGVIADSLIEAISPPPKHFSKCGIGLGGTHYPEKLNRLLLEDPEAVVGVAIPKHSLEFVDADLLRQALSKCDQKVGLAFIDQKGLGKFKERVMSAVDEVGLERVKI